jgi:hypothetical protein
MNNAPISALPPRPTNCKSRIGKILTRDPSRILSNNISELNLHGERPFYRLNTSCNSERRSSSSASNRPLDSKKPKKDFLKENKIIVD